MMYNKYIIISDPGDEQIGTHIVIKSEVELKQLNNTNARTHNGNNVNESINNSTYRVYSIEQNNGVLGQVDTHPYNPKINTTMEEVMKHPKWGVFLCSLTNSEERVS